MTDRAGLAGAPLYLVVGDVDGRLYFFTTDGHLVQEYDTGRFVPPEACRYCTQHTASGKSQLMWWSADCASALWVSVHCAARRADTQQKLTLCSSYNILQACRNIEDFRAMPCNNLLLNAVAMQCQHHSADSHQTQQAVCPSALHPAHMEVLGLCHACAWSMPLQGHPAASPPCRQTLCGTTTPTCWWANRMAQYQS